MTAALMLNVVTGGNSANIAESIDRFGARENNECTENMSLTCTVKFSQQHEALSDITKP